MSDRPDLTAALAALRAAALVVDPAEVPAALGELEQLRALLWPRLTTAPIVRAEPDQLLTADEASARLAVTKDWLRRRPELPFIVRLSDGVVRYSLHGLGRWLATRGR